MVKIKDYNQDLSEKLGNLERLLSTSRQSWLLGAGVSCESNLPLMHKLTELVKSQLSEPKTLNAVNTIFDQLSDNSHIEDFLSYIGDLIAIQSRKSDQTLEFAGENYTLQELKEIHTSITQIIARVIRWGYRDSTEHEDVQHDILGTYDHPFVEVDNHRSFIKALLTLRANLESKRLPMSFFTTNYDTLLEDALALERVKYWDGFSGGAIAFKELRFGDNHPESVYQANLLKLHGSIDWFEAENGEIFRVRDHDNYPSREDNHRVLIYPQSTKYVATQRDPYAAQFHVFRSTIHQSESSNVLCICGYSFSDEHINLEIELAMATPGNKTTLVIFAKSKCALLDKWLHSAWGNRVIILAEDGIYEGTNAPYAIPDNPENNSHLWWKFSIMSEVLKNGLEGSLE
jgi:hypothetical protein